MLFGIFGKKKKSLDVAMEAAESPVIRSNASTSTGASVSEASKVNLIKAEQSLDRHLVNLKKQKNIDFSNHKAQVFLILDFSGSMDSRYYGGEVQNTCTRILPLALRFDDDGKLPVYLFDEGYEQLPPMTIHNYSDYVKKVILSGGRKPWNGTRYAPIIKKVVDDCRREGSKYPTFVIFATDGECWDVKETNDAVRESSKENMFIQFVGIGNDEAFHYLEELDELDGRMVDNTAFFQLSSFDEIGDEELYAKLLNQYPEWLRAKGF